MKLEVNNEGDSYRLTAAVLVYANTEQGHAFATKHEVEMYSGRPVIRPGSPFTEEDYKSLVTAMAPAEQPRMQWHDPRVLANGLGRLMWWSPPKKRSLFFKTSAHNKGTFNGKGICPCPGLVFMATDKSLYVYAFKGTDAPTADSALYQAPFFNVWSSGQVCVGNATLPRDGQRDNIDAWERMFFGSHFTHPNFTQKDRLTVGFDPVQFWQKQVKKPSASFPDTALFDLRLKVSGLTQVDFASRLNEIRRAEGEF
jgi:PRTRC genetic system protein B